MILKVILLCSLLVAFVRGYPSFADSIPNGLFVTNPIRPNQYWPGVGHLNPNGGGPVNPFGRDFSNAGFRWTRTLCQLDSDGDGLTNGQELGDPECRWTPDSAINRGNITHPGIRNRRRRLLVKENKTTK